jgi:hypothetical protein
LICQRIRQRHRYAKACEAARPRDARNAFNVLDRPSGLGQELVQQGQDLVIAHAMIHGNLCDDTISIDKCDAAGVGGEVEKENAHGQN